MLWKGCHLATIKRTVVNDRAYGASKRPTLIMVLQTCSRQQSCCQHNSIATAIWVEDGYCLAQNIFYRSGGHNSKRDATDCTIGIHRAAECPRLEEKSATGLI